ncbi:MAG TPA: Do family serine endopeptidase [Patescibacteria group bacterium]|nr:Do family serine endopeptidase [Patescibacteria group bacterium]
MRRPAALLVIVALVAGALWATGVVTVRVNPPTTDSVSASPFWQERGGEAQLPPPLRIWVDLAKATRPAVVNVSTTQRAKARGPLSDDFFRKFFERGPRDGETPRGRQSLGSGVIASADGYIVTNVHVVADADEIVVRLGDHSEHKAKVVGLDPRTDVALLKIEARDLPALPFGDSDRLEVGEPVMAIGNPFGLEQTVTTGIVSAKERFIGSGPYDDFIQTDASVNPGNSGGPLVDTRGTLVGINTAIFSQTGGSVGIGFAIPVNLAKDVLGQLKERGQVVRGYLGVSVMPVTPEARQAVKLDRARGALVAEIVSGSPAASAGLKPGDVIVAFQGEPIQNPHDLTRRVAGTPPGSKVTLRVARGSGETSVDVTLGRLKDAPPAPAGAER